MTYAILRAEKAKSLAAIGSRAAHNLRANESAAPRADPNRRHLNKIVRGPKTVDGVVGLARQKLDAAPKFRKDAVLAVELVLGASPEFFTSRGKADLEAWARQTEAWVDETFGRDNVISMALHHDETSPHYQVLLVPIHDGKLRASHWFDGPAKLSALQTSYAKRLEALGVRRGEKGSAARHVDLKSFYKLARQLVQAVRRSVDASKPPKLPDRSALGFVRSQDWAELGQALERFGEEGLRLKAEAVVGAGLADSSIGQERLERLQALERKTGEATKQLRDLAGQVEQTRSELAKMQQQHAEQLTQMRRLADQFEIPTLVAHRDRLAAHRDQLAREIEDLTRRRDELRGPRGG